MTKRSTVGPKGQITIPKELRDKYHMHEGEEVVLLAGEEGVLVKHPTASLRGRLKGKLDLKGFEEGVKKIRQQESE